MNLNIASSWSGKINMYCFIYLGPIKHLLTQQSQNNTVFICTHMRITVMCRIVLKITAALLFFTDIVS